MRFTRVLHLPHQREGKHDRAPSFGPHCRDPHCQVCGQDRVAQVQDESMLRHQPRMQP